MSASYTSFQPPRVCCVSIVIELATAMCCNRVCRSRRSRRTPLRFPCARFARNRFMCFNHSIISRNASSSKTTPHRAPRSTKRLFRKLLMCRFCLHVPAQKPAPPVLAHQKRKMKCAISASITCTNCEDAPLRPRVYVYT